MKHLYFFIGTQAELMKMFLVIKKARSQGYICKIISTGQNDLLNCPYLELSESIIDMDISSKKSMEKSTKGYSNWFLSTAINGKKELKKYFTKEKRENALAFIHGDTLTTTLGAYICKSIKLPYVHVESGLRSFNFLSPFPEEIDRLYGSTYSVMNFCPGKIHAEYAEKKFKGKAIDTIYNTGIETLYDAIYKNNGEKHPYQPYEDYFMFMLHRQENILNKKFVINIVEQILKMANKMKCVFIYHDQTKAKMEQFNVFHKLESHPNITIIPRQSYLDFIKLVSYTKFIATDGCGNQQEFFYMGKPYLILRTAVEKNTEGLGWNAKIFEGEFEQMLDFIEEYPKYTKEPVKPEVSPSDIILENIALL